MLRVKLFLVVLFIGSAIISKSQNDSLFSNNITTAEIYKKGVYKNIDEFRTNNPSITEDFILLPRKYWKQKYFNMSKNVLMVKNEKGKKKKYKEDIWGYSDGNRVYIKEDALYEIEVIGAFCIYDVSSIATNNQYYASGWDYTSDQRSSYLTKFIIDIKTGSTYNLSKYNLRVHVLPKDTALFDEFKAKYFKREMLLEYIQKYNRRNPVE